MLCGLFLSLLSTALPVLGEDTLGGIFLRDLRVSNNGNSVFFEDFNAEELCGWNTVNTGAWTTEAPGEPAKFCLYLNRETDENAGVARKIECSKVGTLEISAYVYCPAPEQQWAYTHGARSRTRIDLETKRGEHGFYLTIDLNPGETGYRVGLVHMKPELREMGNGVEKYESQGVVITPQKWTHLSFKLNPSARTATVSVDGKPQVSCEYSPDKISSVDYVDLTTWMGDQERETVDRTYAKKSGRRVASYTRKKQPSG
jgi:hypothetical protein